MNQRLFGRFICNYRLDPAVPLASKVVSVTFLWLTITASILFAVQLWWLRALLLLVAIGVSRHILALKTLTREIPAEINPLNAENIDP